MNLKASLNDEGGQGMIEYVILVALVAVAAIGSIKLLQRSINVTLANSINSLQGRNVERIQHEQVQQSHYRKKDLSDFFKGASNGRKSLQ